MRAATGAGLGATTRRPSSGITHHVLCGGQSLSVGFGQAPSLTTVQPYSNVMVHDTSGTYDITNPNAGTLQFSPLVSPPRAGINAGIYPQNINNSENPDVAFANQLTALYRANRYADYVLATTNHGQGGALLSAIAKGTTSYNAAVFEGKVVKRLASQSAPLAMLWLHGEADATAFTANYAAALELYRLNMLADWAQAIWGFSGQVPFILSQQNSSPVNLTGPNLTAAAMLQLAQGSPGQYLMTGPKYIWPTPGDALHLAEYRALAEKMAECLFRWQVLGQLMTCWPVGSASRSGNVVTLTYNVCCPPLLFDQSIATPHGPSTIWNMWAQGLGFEAGDNPLTIASCSGATTPVTLTFTGNHNYGPNGTQVTIAVQGINGTTNANGVFLATVTGPTTVTLPITGNGAFTGMAYGGPTVFTPIGITGVAVLNPMSRSAQVQVTLARPPVQGGFIAYGEQSDCPYGQNTSSVGQGRWGNLRDSDPFWRVALHGPNSGTALPANYYYNWGVEFTMGLA